MRLFEMGDFTIWPLPTDFVGVAACFIDRTTTMLVEMQHLQMNKPLPAGVPANAGGGVHFSIISALGSNMTANTTDHEVMASNYLIRGEYTAVVTLRGRSA